MGIWAGVFSACSAVGRLVYPPFCTICGVGLRGWDGARDGAAILNAQAAGHLCAGCEGGVRAYGSAFGGGCCVQCSKGLGGRISGWVRCTDCMARGPAFECVVAPYLARGSVREVVHQFKYWGRRHLCGLLARWMAVGLEDERLRAPPPDLLVPVPLHWLRRMGRGFNQAELLARELSGGGGWGSRVAGVPVCLALRRGRATGTQTRLDRGQRLGNLSGAIEARRVVRSRVEGKKVLLVDDIFTTGATLDVCARALLCIGAASVRALAVARG